MKIMNVSLTIDVCNPQQVSALKQLMDALAGEPVNAVTPAVAIPAVATVPTPVEEAPKATRVRKKKVEPVQQAVEVEADETEDEVEEDDNLLGEDEEIDITTLRQLTAEKASTHRAEIKAKLAEFNAANVTSLPEDKYSEYLKFITSL